MRMPLRRLASVGRPRRATSQQHQLHGIRAPATTAAARRAPGGVGSAYVHLPFCKRKCLYCDFPVEAVGSRGGTAASSSVLRRMEHYVQLVCLEIEATPATPGPLSTVYFGGGTPSLVPPALIAAILDRLDARFGGIASGAEVTLEADPGTFDAPRLREYQRLGVTRVSVGVQSFQQELLDACGRSHGLADVHAALDAVASAGFASWSLDLISGLPYLTPAAWEASLAAAVAAGAPHVSVYDLQVEPGTPFARRYPSPGVAPLPDDDTAAAMYAAAAATLGAAGYEHYEVSSYARLQQPAGGANGGWAPGPSPHRSRHNQVYWSSAPYHAFGLGAASFLDGRRFTRPARMRDYEAWLAQYCSAGSAAGAKGDEVVPQLPSLPGAHLPPQSQEDLLLDTVMLQLRTSDGLDLGALRTTHGEDAVGRIKDALRPHVAAGRAAWLQGGHMDRVRLTDPTGFLLSNNIISDVFAALSGNI